MISEISQRLRAQDARGTQHPMFCLQIKARDVGYDPAYANNFCWLDSANETTVFDDDPGFKEPEGEEWEQFGYVDRWETVMVAFTEGGLNQYMEADGHNVRRRAFRGETRIYVESFHRCREMIAVREGLSDSLFTVEQIRRYLEGCVTEYASGAPAPGNTSLLNALSQLEDRQDGIAAVIERSGS
jgi:hypothetical protein